MNQPTPTEPEMRELPEVYSTMPNKWEKWTPRTKNQQKREVFQNYAIFFGKTLK